MKKSALLLTLLFLVPLFPVAEAAGPEPRTWSAYSAPADVSHLAMAREGTTIVATLREPAAPQPGVIPPLPGGPSDVSEQVSTVVLDHDHGFATRFNISALSSDAPTLVAVSRDGLTMVVVRQVGKTQVTPSGAETTLQYIQVHYARLAPGGNWSAGPSYQRVLDLGLQTLITPIAITLSDDGSRAAVLTQEGANYVLRGYGGTTSSFDSAFEIRQPGTARALASSGDLSRNVVAGQFPQANNLTHGGAFLLHFAQAEPIASYFDTGANNTDVRSVVMSRDAQTIALGGSDGRLHLFKDARDALPTPTQLSLGSAAVGNITLSEDGTRLASAMGTGITMVNTSEATPVVIWNATVGGQNITGLALNRTGALLVVGAGGTGGGVHAYADVDSTLLWSIPGDTRAVAIDSAGTRVAYAQRAAVGAARIPRALTMDLVGGGKIAPTQTVTVPGTMNVEVNLRNDGAALERIVFEENTPDITVSSDPSIVTVRPGAIVRANVTVSVNPGLLGQRVFNVSARSITSGAIDNVTLSVMPRPTLDVKLQLNATDLLAEPGRPAELLVTIVNNGTGDAPVIVRASQQVSGGALWNLSTTETQLTALRSTRSSLRVTITPPADAANGTSAVVTFTLQGQDIFDTARVSFRINPELKVEVLSNGSVTRFIEPGKRAFYNVTVTNIGSLPREFDVFYTITSSDNRNWGVDMPSQKVRLEPLAKRGFPVTIVAPADALPQERVAVLVSARSIPELPNETIVEDNVTLYGIAIEPRLTTTTTPDNIPFATPLAVVAAIVLLGVLLPRRRSQ